MVVPQERGLLLAHGRGYAPVIRPGIRAEIPPAPPRIVVARACSYGGIVVDVDSDTQGAESLSLLDSRGETVMMTIMAGSATLGAHAVGLDGGRSDLIQTDESVTTIVLFKDGMEARRVPVELTPGTVNEIRL